MSELQEITDLLGIGKNPVAPLEFVDLVQEGLPLKSLNRLSVRIAPADATFKYRLVPKATLARYAVRLNSMQSNRIARVARLWAFARRIWGSDERTRDFLFQPHQLLNGRPPIDVAIENEIGAELVRDILGRLEFGSAV